ncbi:hypothetical protein ACTFIU_011153 [Dictyostelium citrinum]
MTATPKFWIDQTAVNPLPSGVQDKRLSCSPEGITQSSKSLAVKAQASLGRVLRNNISKKIYGSQVLQPIKNKDTPKMFDETETERVRKLAKPISSNFESVKRPFKEVG